MKKTKKRGPNVRSAMRKMQLSDEIAQILKSQVHDWLRNIESRENTLSKRLNSIEQSAMPYNAVQEIKAELSRLAYCISKNTRGIEILFSFFGATKRFLNEASQIKELCQHTRKDYSKGSGAIFCIDCGKEIHNT